MSDQQKSPYERLAESVGPMGHLPNGAAFHTGEQIITHLNRTLGPERWSFEILDYGMEEDSDECWVFAQLTAIIDDVTVVKQDYGSQAIKRSRQSGKFISKGEDRKAAATDALKRCARLLGVGLDAWANERAPSWRPDDQDESSTARAGNAPGSNRRQDAPPPGDGQTLTCEDCGEALRTTHFKDGSDWSPEQLAVYGQRKHGRTLCMSDYRKATAAKRQQEEGAAF